MDAAMLCVEWDLLRGPLHIIEPLRVLLPPKLYSEEPDCWRKQQIYKPEQVTNEIFTADAKNILCFFGISGTTGTTGKRVIDINALEWFKFFYVSRIWWQFVVIILKKNAVSSFRYTKDLWYDMICYDMIYLLTAVGLSPGGSTHLHTNNT